MLIETLKTIFHRDLNKLITELELYTNERVIWNVDKDIANSAGNITLHLVGNLNNYIGMVLGKVDYVRDREFEFAAKGIPREELISKVQATIAIIERSLDDMPIEALNEDFPIMVFGDKMTTEFFLVHLAAHLNYHLGQVNYHRRLLAQRFGG